MNALFRCVGRIMFVAIFVASAINHAKDIEGTVKHMHPSFPEEMKLPAAYAVVGLAMAGSLFLALGRAVPMGAVMLLLFLGPVTYFQHFLPFQAGSEGPDMTAKNLSMMGGAMAMLGYSVRSKGLAFLGRLLLCTFLVLAAYQHYIATDALLFLDRAQTLAQGLQGHASLSPAMAELLTPANVLYAVGATLGAAGSLTVLGVAPKVGSFVLAAVLGLETYLKHVVVLLASEQPAGAMIHVIHTLKNVSIMGALLAVAGYASTLSAAPTPKSRASSGSKHKKSGKAKKNKH